MAKLHGMWMRGSGVREDGDVDSAQSLEVDGLVVVNKRGYGCGSQKVKRGNFG